jgi:hypothetical protein
VSRGFSADACAQVVTCIVCSSTCVSMFVGTLQVPWKTDSTCRGGVATHARHEATSTFVRSSAGDIKNPVERGRLKSESSSVQEGFRECFSSGPRRDAKEPFPCFCLEWSWGVLAASVFDFGSTHIDDFEYVVLLLFRKSDIVISRRWGPRGSQQR